MRFSCGVVSAIVAPLMLAGAGTASGSATCSITDLCSLGFGLTDGLGINANGQVAGYLYSSTEEGG